MVADKLLTRSELPDLYTGVTFADFHAVGTIPEFKDRFIMCVTGAAIILAQSFRRFGGKESVPAALFLLRFLSYIRTETYEKVKNVLVLRGSFL